MKTIMHKALSLCLLLLLLLVEVQAKNNAQAFNIVFIGNSITHGASLKAPLTQAPPVMAAKYLNGHGCQVQYANCGVSGSTTVDFLPATNRLFPRVIKAADTLYSKGAPLIFSIMLGTNDSAIKGPKGAPVSPDDYRKNMLTIIDNLIQRYPKCHIILHQPIWYSPNTHNKSMYLAEGLARLQTYTPQIVAISKLRSEYVSVGDRKAFDFFKKNSLKYFTAENGNSGIFYLHPNASGAEKLGEFWAKALIRYH